MSSVKAGMTDLTKALRQRRAESVSNHVAKAGKASGKGKNGGKAKGKGKPQTQAGVTFIATAAEKGRQVQVVELDEGGTLASVELQMMSLC